MAVRPPVNSAKETMAPSEDKRSEVGVNKTYSDSAKNKMKRERPEERRGSVSSAKRSKVSPVKRTGDSRSPSTEFDWNVDNEVLFLTAMMGHKPVGVNKHFEMVCILNKFQELLNRDVDSKVIWDRLDTMYNMERLNEAERIPFPNEESEFALPDEEFSSLMKVKLEEIDLKVEEPVVEEVVPEPKREQKRELQVYKGMKDIKKETTREVKSPAKPVETVPSPVKEEKKEKKQEVETKKPAVDKRLSKEGKKGRPSTPAPTPAAAPTPAPRKERRQSGEKPPSKGRTSVASKKEDKSELKKERVRELTPVSAKAKRSTRGSVTDSASNKSASPVTTANNKRKKKN